MLDVSESAGKSRQLLLITHPSIQANAFASYLSDLLSVYVDVHNINKPLTPRLMRSLIILFDIAVSNKKLNGIWRNIIQSQVENPRLLIINSAKV